MTFVLVPAGLVAAIHDQVLEPNELQRLAGVKSLDSALSRVENRQAYGLIDDIYVLAAAYAAGISQDHCFNDGNKRTAFQVLDIVLNLNAVQISWDVEEVGQKIIQLSRSQLDDRELANWLRHISNSG